MMLKPFFSFYGSKFRASKNYPIPKYETIIEPFAGSAGYSCTKGKNKEIVLIERDPKIAGIWKYLKKSKPKDILILPNLNIGECVDDLKICEEEKWLVGFWLNKGKSAPSKSPSKWMRNPKYKNQFWGEKIKKRIAEQLQYIKNWKIIEGEYWEFPNEKCTWFIDPPYIEKGKYYIFNDIDYSKLADWIYTLKGQVIVCEQEGAKWLPFKSFKKIKSNHTTTFSNEVIYLQNEPLIKTTLINAVKDDG